MTDSKILFDDFYYDCEIDQTALTMPLHGRHRENVTEDYFWTGLLSDNLMDTSEYFATEQPFIVKKERKDEYLIDRGRKASLFNLGDADETLFGRVYVSPLAIDAEFITEYVEYDVVVWNAYFTKSVDITSILVQNQAGTNMVYPTLPKTIPLSYNEVLTLIVYDEGPPTQDTDWLITVDGVEFNIDVTGIRVIAFVHEPDFSKSVTMVYNFLTSLAQNLRYLKEQRRPLQRLPFRDINFICHAKDLVLQKLVNTIHYGKDKVFAVPIFTEHMRPSAISAGSNSITIADDITYYYNLQNNCDYLIILDETDLSAEVKEISEIDGQDITFTSNVTGSYTAGSCSIYPCVFSYGKGFKVAPETKNNAQVTVSFGEFKRTAGV